MGCTPAWSGSSAANAEGCARAERAAFTSADLLYFHRFDPTTPVEESLAAVEDLVRQDLVRYFAVSNFTVDQLALYAAAETHLSLRCRVLAVQNQWDMVQGESAACRGVLEYAARCGLVFVAYSPLARGLLTERYLEPGRAGSGDRLVDEGALANLATPQTMATRVAPARSARPSPPLVRALADLAHGWGLPLSQLALAYMLGLPGVGPAIPSASSVAQLEENAGAGRVTLSAEQRERVRAVVEGEQAG